MKNQQPTRDRTSSAARPPQEAAQGTPPGSAERKPFAVLWIDGREHFLY